MKKMLSIFITACMLMAVVPYACLAADNQETHLTLMGMTGELVETDESSEILMMISTGQYNEGTIKFTFTQSDVSYTNYPYVRFEYRIADMSTAVATLRSSAGSATIVVTLMGFDDYYNASTDAELVFISAGYNDYLADVSLSDFETALQNTFEAAHTAFPDAVIVYVTPFNLTKEENGAGLKLKAYAEAAAEAAQTSLVTVTDIYERAEIPFALLDRNGNAGQLITKYIDEESRHLTQAGAEAFTTSLSSLLKMSGAIQVLGEDVADVPLFVRGDVNASGIIETLDRVFLSRHFAKWSDYLTIEDLRSADINFDGYVTVEDDTALARYFANWTGYTDILD